jgi:hypothetical protein
VSHCCEEQAAFGGTASGKGIQRLPGFKKMTLVGMVHFAVSSRTGFASPMGM